MRTIIIVAACAFFLITSPVIAQALPEDKLENCIFVEPLYTKLFAVYEKHDPNLSDIEARVFQLQGKDYFRSLRWSSR